MLHLVKLVELIIDYYSSECLLFFLSAVSYSSVVNLLGCKLIHVRFHFSFFMVLCSKLKFAVIIVFFIFGC